MNELFKAAVEREIKKRESAYPKIIAKMKKKGLEALDITLTENHQGRAMYYLALVLKWIETKQVFGHNMVLVYDELLREYRMRVKCYPRWVYLKRMDPETATTEIATWKALCEAYARGNMGQNQDGYIALLDKK